MDSKGGEKIIIKTRFSLGPCFILLKINIFLDFIYQNLRKMDSS
jgi:hypothetical protein